MTEEEKNGFIERIRNEDDFIYYPRYGNSLKTFIKQNNNGVDNVKIGKALLMSEDEVEKALKSAIGKLQKLMRV